MRKEIADLQTVGQAKAYLQQYRRDLADNQARITEVEFELAALNTEMTSLQAFPDDERDIIFKIGQLEAENV